jgi:hypothetical protein
MSTCTVKAPIIGTSSVLLFPLMRLLENPSDFYTELIKQARLQKEAVAVPRLDRGMSSYNQDRNVLGSFVFP